MVNSAENVKVTLRLKRLTTIFLKRSHNNNNNNNNNNDNNNNNKNNDDDTKYLYSAYTFQCSALNSALKRSG